MLLEDVAVSCGTLQVLGNQGIDGTIELGMSKRFSDLGVLEKVLEGTVRGNADDLGKSEGRQILGGLGSTRWNEHNVKRCVEDCLAFDVDQLVSAGLFNHQVGVIEWWSDHQTTAAIAFRLKPSDVPEVLYLYLFYDLMRQGKLESYEQPIPIEIRRQRIGKRYFFRCHLFCISRVRILYRPSNRTIFGCRNCHKLTYRSAQEHDKGMDIFRRRPDTLSAAVDAGSVKGIVFCLRNLGVTRTPQTVFLKVVGPNGVSELADLDTQLAKS